MEWVKLSLEQQLKHAKSREAEERVAFSSYPVLPVVADYMVGHEKDKRIIETVFRNLFEKPNSDIWASTLAKAARVKVEVAGVSEYDNALTNIALHLNTDIETLEYLFTLNNHHVNWGLACNPNTPKAMLDKLSEIDEFNLDEALLYNPNTCEETKNKIWARYKNGFFSVGYFYDLKHIEVVASGN